MLPVGVDFFVSCFLLIIDRVAFMPSAHVLLHPWLQVPLIDADFITAFPFVTVGNTEVEVGSSKVSLKIVSDLEALSGTLICLASTNLAIVCACVSLSTFFHIS